MTNWVLIEEKADIELMAATLKISKTVAQVLVNRNVRTKNTALRFLNPTLETLTQPFLITDMDKAVHLVANAITDQVKVAIYGDYDVDGVMSTAILYKALTKLGADVCFVIPDREREGYGLNVNAVNQLHADGVGLILTCDNGIASIEEVARAKTLGMTVVIIDHHEPGNTLPQADALVDPKQPKCTFAFKSFCAAGLCFKFAQALHEHFGVAFEAAREMMVLAAMATICDIVELKGENRVLVKHGLWFLNANKKINTGLYALLNVKSYTEREVDGFCVGFVLGPCINAAGRLEKATTAVNLFISEDQHVAHALATRLSELNEVRKTITNAAYESAATYVESSNLMADKVIVILDKDAHESIAGIVAGKLKERYHKPFIILTPAADYPSNFTVKGSARSIIGYNMFEALNENKDLFLRFGGHAMAAGLSLHAKNVHTLHQRLNDACTLTEADFINSLNIDGVLPLTAVTYELAEALLMLAPFGSGNPEPLFLTKRLPVESLRVLEEKHTIIFGFKNEKTGRHIKGICFSKTEQFKVQIETLYNPRQCDKLMHGLLRDVNLFGDFVYSIQINAYKNSVSVQMNIKDFTLQPA